MRSRKTSRASGDDRSSVTARLLRPIVFHHSPMPFLLWPWPRDASGRARVLDLDDVGAEVAQVRRRERAGKQGRRLDDLHTGERPAHVVVPSSSIRSYAQRNPMRDDRCNPPPGSTNLSSHSGGCGPPSTYHDGARGRVVTAALEQDVAGDAVGAFGIGQVPHEWLLVDPRRRSARVATPPEWAVAHRAIARRPAHRPGRRTSPGRPAERVARAQERYVSVGTRGR